ncbi:MAG TPA: hypothetical protein VLE22_22990 [Bryobacteraceae bacterium]|nr:hypothetical protein [Bryobacteraceae bacterium]
MTRTPVVLARRLAEAWCRFAHQGIYWPVCGQYRCKVCLLTHAVHWP